MPADPTTTGVGSEFQHGGILDMPLADLVPARVNDTIYKPLGVADPEMIEFAERLRGLDPKYIDPIVITEDNVIISGHRRRVAYMILGVATVRVRKLPIHSTDPRVPELIVGFNNQREKSADEIFREELVRLDPSESHERLQEYRRAAATVRRETMVITGEKRRARISPAKWPMLDAIVEVIDTHREFWPLSDRLIHYRLLNNPPLKHASKPGSQYTNDAQSYNALTELLSRARLSGDIPHEAIHDPTRPVTTWRVFPGIKGFVTDELSNFMQGYYRDLQRSQPLHIEIVGEKNTVEGTIRPVACDYTLPLTISRGYSSIPPRRDMVERFRRSGKDKLLILFVSDCDPEGDDIAHAFARSIRDDFGVSVVEGIKVALTRDQAADLNLPPAATAKTGSSRRKGFVERHGSDHVWELEAVPPGRLQEILRQHIEGVLDMDLFQQEKEREVRDAVAIEAARYAIRQTALQVLGTMPEGNSSKVEFGTEQPTSKA